MTGRRETSAGPRRAPYHAYSGVSLTCTLFGTDLRETVYPV